MTQGASPLLVLPTEPWLTWQAASVSMAVETREQTENEVSGPFGKQCCWLLLAFCHVVDAILRFSVSTSKLCDVTISKCVERCL